MATETRVVPPERVRSSDLVRALPDPELEIDALRQEVALLRVALVHARTSDRPLPAALRPALARALLALRG
jgi:hypothetical protein